MWTSSFGSLVPFCECLEGTENDTLKSFHYNYYSACLLFSFSGKIQFFWVSWNSPLFGGFPKSDKVIGILYS